MAKTKLAISPDSQFVVVGSQNGSVIVLDIKSGNSMEIAEIYDDEHAYAVVGVEWVPGKSSFASIDKSGGLLLWSS
jgi:WD40 repeat protein